MSTLTAPSPAPDTASVDEAPPAAGATAPRPVRSDPSLPARYLGAMLYFMGAALIAGGVVHLPLDPPRYTLFCVIGVGVFLLGTVVNEFVLAPERPTVRRAAVLVGASLFLSFGVGMLGGGIQHFEEFPQRAAVMSPIGLAMSYLAYVAKDPAGRWRHVLGPVGAGVAALALVTWLGMSAIADSMDTTGHGHGDSHEPTSQTTGVQDQRQDERQDERPNEQTRSATADEGGAVPGEAGDGHSSHGH